MLYITHLYYLMTQTVFYNDVVNCRTFESNRPGSIPDCGNDKSIFYTCNFWLAQWYIKPCILRQLTFNRWFGTMIFTILFSCTSIYTALSNDFVCLLELRFNIATNNISVMLRSCLQIYGTFPKLVG